MIPLHFVWIFLKLVREKGVISPSPYLDVLKIRMERRRNDWNRQIYSYLKIDLQHWFIINLERINWEIYLLYFPSKSLKFGRIKNEGLEVVETSPNSSTSFLKKLPNKVIELLSLPLLYSPSFFNLPNRP